MKILFIGCVKSSELLLNTLLENNFEISGVVTKSSSIINSDYADLSGICSKHNIPTFDYSL